MVEPVPASAAFHALRAGITLCFSDPSLKRWLIAALVINSVAFTGLFYGSFLGIDALMDWGFQALAPSETSWFGGAVAFLADGLRWVVYVCLVLGALVYAPVFMALIASLVLPPIYGPVFARARRCAGGSDDALHGTSVWRSVLTDLRRVFRFIALSAALLLLNVIPVFGSILYVVAQFYLGAKTLGWDLLAHHFELHGLPLDEQRRWVRSRPGLVLSFGAGATLLVMIPLFQVVFLTTNIASAGVLSAWLDGAPREARLV